MRKLELGGILDRHDALAGGNLARQCVEQRGLARARASRNRQILPQRHRARQQLRIPKRQRPQPHELVQRTDAVGELADGEDWPVDRHGWNHRVDAIARLEAGVDDGATLVDTTAQRRDDAVDEHTDLLVVLKRVLDRIQNAAALKKGRATAVDHDFGNGVVLDERLQRSQAHHVI